MSGMGRREFVALLGGAAAWPLVAGSQQAAMPVIGFLSSLSPESALHLTEAFRRGLSEVGYVESQNVTIEYKWALGRYDRLPELAAAIAGRPVDILITVGGEGLGGQIRYFDDPYRVHGRSRSGRVGASGQLQPTRRQRDRDQPAERDDRTEASWHSA
jgi:hypothetical protein